MRYEHIILNKNNTYILKKKKQYVSLILKISNYNRGICLV